MTKSGPNGPKSRARARKERDGTKYTQAARGTTTAAEPGEEPELTVYTIAFSNGKPVPWEAVRTWQCHHCGTTGSDPAGTDACILVLEDGVTYLRPHCPQCLPTPTTKEFPPGRKWGDPKPPECTHHRSQEGQRSSALVEAVRTGVVRASWLDPYRCSVCGRAWSIGPRVKLPCGVLYDSTTDLFEHPCSTCLASLSEEELSRTHHQRSRQL
ncbi:hypothetical protein [Streptomyces chattanoogensis]|uniref:hypothetical protein n=1 Tax=Streptomyces chattanoogensis TaxID=66876 RepID=UPI0036BC0E82